MSDNHLANDIVIEHRPDCPVAQPGFVPNLDGPQQCNCDLGRRLKRLLTGEDETGERLDA